MDIDKNRLKINSVTSNGLPVWGKAQWKSSNVDEFTWDYETLEWVESAKYLAMSINPDILWDLHA